MRSIRKLSSFILSSALILVSCSCTNDISSAAPTSEMPVSAPVITTEAPVTTSVTSSATTVTTTEITTTTAEPEPEPVYEERSFPADERYVKMIGRTYYSDDTLWLIHSASGIDFTFTGDHASVTIAGDSSIYGKETSKARMAVYVNGVRTIDEMITAAEKTYDIWSSDVCKLTKIKILKLSEPSHSAFGIKSIDVGSYGDIEPMPPKALNIEFIGDSITCGYGIDESEPNNHFSTEIEDATKTYAYKTAEKLGADYSIVAFSGNGILSGFTNSTEKRNTYDLLPKKYVKTGSVYTAGGTVIPDTDWDFGRFIPDIVVINLGTNDATYTAGNSEKELAFEEEYVKFIGTVREYNPSAHIICTLGMISADLYDTIVLAADYYTASTGDTNISTLKFATQDGSLGYGADWHPSEGTNELAAELLTEHIKNLHL